jgi:hypothetical protein
MNNNLNTKVIKFSEIKDRLFNEINSKITSLGLSGPVTLVEGFINQPLSMELSSSFTIGGPSIPMIMIVENETGRIHFFALKALLPDITL